LLSSAGPVDVQGPGARRELGCARGSGTSDDHVRVLQSGLHGRSNRPCCGVFGKANFLWADVASVEVGMRGRPSRAVPGPIGFRQISERDETIVIECPARIRRPLRSGRPNLEGGLFGDAHWADRLHAGRSKFRGVPGLDSIRQMSFTAANLKQEMRCRPAPWWSPTARAFSTRARSRRSMPNCPSQPGTSLPGHVESGPDRVRIAVRCRARDDGTPIDA
jgi:hypothetical protein